MANLSSHTEKQLALLFSRRLGARLKQCVSLIEQGFENNWPADIFHQLHQHINTINRGAQRFGYDSIAEALNELQQTLNNAAHQLQPPDEDEIRRILDPFSEFIGSNILPLPKTPQPAEFSAQPAAEDSSEDEVELPEALLAKLSPTPDRPIFIVSSEPGAELCDNLAIFGYRSQVFASLEEMVPCLSAERPQLVIMPLPDDNEIQHVHMVISTHHLRTLFYSATDNLACRLRCVRAGGDDLLVAPLDDYHLLLCLDKIAAPINQAPLRALVVEDSKSQGTFCLRLLRKVGMSAEWIDTPEQLIHTCRRFQPEVILMDMQLPGCSGIELAAILKQFPDTRTIPIVFVSAEDNSTNTQISPSSGDAFIEKPISAENLVSTVLHRAALYRQTREIRVRDELTGLPNFDNFMQTLIAATSRAARDGVGFSLLCFEIWQLDKIRAERGEAGANRVLQTLGHLLRHRIRCSDFVARIHDNRFAVILYDCNEIDADRIARAVNGLYRQAIHGFLPVAENLAWGCTCLTTQTSDAVYREALRRLQDNVERMHA